ncbi:MAG: hypothetical protein OXN89_04945 [Bryobacterales bacterium]|nr:hypothetical protein [Bryobacterales bacterium]
MLATGDERLRALEPSFGYWLRDLGHIPVERLAADPAARVGLVALRYSHKGEYAEMMRVLPEVPWAVPDWSEFEIVLDQSSRKRLASAVPDLGQPAQLR